MAAGKRSTGISYDEYKTGLKAEERWLKQRVRGVLVWPRGTYRRPHFMIADTPYQRPLAYKARYATLNGTGKLP